MFTEESAGIRDVIEKNEQFVIITHANPDGDAIGSSLGWYNLLINMGKKADVILPNDCPGFLKWIHGAEHMHLFMKNRKNATELIKNADALILVDFNKLERIDEVKYHINKCKGKKVLVDHHPEPDDFADYIVSDPGASSASELVYHVFESIGAEQYIDTNVAEAIYIGIITDTGGLNHNSSNPATYNTIAKLLGKGIDKTKIHEYTFNVHSADRMQLLGKVLCQNMNIYPEYNAACIYITREDQQKYNFAPGDSEGFVNYPLSIKGIKFSALFTENEELTKVSLRSKDQIPANAFSAHYFNGGGHLNAAGGRLKKSLAETIAVFEEGLESFKQYLQ